MPGSQESSSREKTLSNVQAALLHALWRRKRARDGRVASPEDLVGALDSEFPGIDAQKVKKALRKLAERGLVEQGAATKTDDTKPGPAPTGYRLADDGQNITWRSSATIVLALFNYPFRPADETQFVSEVMPLGLFDDKSKTPLTRDDVVRQIDFCIKSGYIHEEKVADGSRRLQCTSKVDQQIEFLRMITVPPKPAAAEPGISPSVAAGGDPGGDELQK